MSEAVITALLMGMFTILGLFVSFLLGRRESSGRINKQIGDYYGDTIDRLMGDIENLKNQVVTLKADLAEHSKVIEIYEAKVSRQERKMYQQAREHERVKATLEKFEALVDRIEKILVDNHMLSKNEFNAIKKDVGL